MNDGMLMLLNQLRWSSRESWLRCYECRDWRWPLPNTATKSCCRPAMCSVYSPWERGLLPTAHDILRTPAGTLTRRFIIPWRAQA